MVLRPFYIAGWASWAFGVRNGEDDAHLVAKVPGRRGLANKIQDGLQAMEVVSAVHAFDVFANLQQQLWIRSPHEPVLRLRC